MGSSTTIAPAPPPPAPIDPGKSSLDYINSMADPALQQRLYDAEAQFRPQYNELNLRDMEQYLLGSNGQAGALDLFGQSSAAAQGFQSQANTAQRAADIADVSNLGQQASAAFRAANPELQAQIGVAQGLQGGANPYGGFANAMAQGQPNFGQINFNPAQATMAGGGPAGGGGVFTGGNPNSGMGGVGVVGPNGYVSGSGSGSGSDIFYQAGDMPSNEQLWDLKQTGTLGSAGGGGPNSGIGGGGPAGGGGYSPFTGGSGMGINIPMVQYPANGSGLPPGMNGPQAPGGQSGGGVPSAQASLLGAAPQAASQGYQGQGYAASMLGAAPQAASQGYNATNVGNVSNIGADQVGAAQVGSGQLGGSLYSQAMGANGLGSVGQSLQARAGQMANSTGQLSPDELRQLTQSTREGYAARGTEMGAGAITGEAMARLTNQRERMMQDVGMASGLNQAAQQELGANRGFAQSVQGQDISRQQQNAALGLNAQGMNQGANLSAAAQNQGMQGQMALANQGAQNQAAQFGAASQNQANQFNAAQMSQYGLANQASQNQASMYGADAGNQAAQFGAASQNQANQYNAGMLGQYGMANQASQNQTALANMGMQGQYGLANMGMQGQYGLANMDAANQFALYNSQAGLATQEANRNFAAQQYQQNLGNLGVLGQYNAGNQSAQQQYALQLAQMQAGIASDPFQAILGRSSGALQYGQGQAGMASQAGQNAGPQLFDPNAGINLALQNNANQSNYNSSIYGANASLAGARAGANGAMIGAGIGAAGALGSAAMPALIAF